MSYQPTADQFTAPTVPVTRSSQQADQRRYGGGRTTPPPAVATGVRFAASYDREQRPGMVRITMVNDTDQAVIVLRRVGNRRAEAELQPRSELHRDHKYVADDDEIVCTVNGQPAFRSTVGDVIRSAPPDVRLYNVAVDGRHLEPDLWSRPGEEHRFRVPLGPTVRLGAVEAIGDGAAAWIVNPILGEVAVSVGNSDVAVYTSVESLVPGGGGDVVKVW